MLRSSRVPLGTDSDLKPGSTNYAKVVIAEVVDPSFARTRRFLNVPSETPALSAITGSMERPTAHRVRRSDRLDFERRPRLAVAVDGWRIMPLKNPIRWFTISLMTGCGLLSAAWGRENVASDSPDDIQHLPTFIVAEPRDDDFLLRDGPVVRNTDGTSRLLQYSGPTRMWLIQWPGKKNSPPFQPPIPSSECARYMGSRFRGHGLKSGDEIVRISGKSVAEMPPGECIKLFLTSVNDPEKKGVEVEVQAKGEKGVRKVTVTKVRFNEVIVVTPNPVLPLTPLPLPISSAPEPRAAK
jgi:hypothetical protein